MLGIGRVLPSADGFLDDYLYGCFMPALSACASALSSLFGVGVWCCRPTACLMNDLGVDGVYPSRVTVIVLPCGSTVVLACALPVVWPFLS